MAGWTKDPEGGMPVFVPESKANNVSMVTTSEAQDANNIAIGVKTPGWVYYSQHTRADGHVARRVDTLVSFRRGNAWPTISAGDDQTVDSEDAVVLTGTATHAQSLAMTYQWTQVSGPEVTLATPTTLTSGFDAPTLEVGDPDVTIVVELAVTDPNITVRDTVSITVQAPLA